jgi:hypothetical protein
MGSPSPNSTKDTRKNLQKIRQLWNKSNNADPFLFCDFIDVDKKLTVEEFCINFVIQKYFLKKETEMDQSLN